MTDHELYLKSIHYRIKLLKYIKMAGAGHTGGSLSCVDILNVLYNRVLNVSADAFDDPGRQQIAAEDIAIDGKSETAEKIERCGLCGRAIPKTETPWVIKRKVIVCKGCYDKISGS